MTNLLNTNREELNVVCYDSWRMSGMCVSAEKFDGNMVMKIDCGQSDYKNVFINREMFDTENLFKFLNDTEGKALFEMKGYVLGGDFLVCTDLSAKTPAH